MANEKIEFDFTEIFKDERIGFLSTIHKDSGHPTECYIVDTGLQTKRTSYCGRQQSTDCNEYRI